MPVVSATFPAGEVLGSIPAPWCKTFGLKFAQNFGNEEHAQNVLHFFFEELKKIENRVAWFLAELCKAKKGLKWSSHLCSSSGWGCSSRFGDKTQTHPGRAFLFSSSPAQGFSSPLLCPKVLKLELNGCCVESIVSSNLLRTHLSCHFLPRWRMSDLVHWPTQMIDIYRHTLTGPSGLLYLQAQLIEFVANVWQVVPTRLTFHHPHWVCV